MRPVSNPIYRVIGLLLAVCSLLLGGCGFHLRGMGSATFPPQLLAMRVTMGGAAAYPPLLVEVRDALRTEAGVRLVNDVAAKVPALTLSGETVTSDVVAIDITGMATDYQLNYKVSFSLSDAAGHEIISDRTIKLQREYSFNKLSVLATERDSRSLLDQMRRDAVEQIIRQLASVQR
ncbi:MAG: LPS-assembly lipoprotein LptE [Acidiferrobacterales bacterium]